MVGAAGAGDDRRPDPVRRGLPDGVAALGRERLAELTWLVGYYSALALSLAVFRPVLPESFSDGR